MSSFEIIKVEIPVTSAEMYALGQSLGVKHPSRDQVRAKVQRVMKEHFNALVSVYPMKGKEKKGGAR
jgi:hypothetical protein